MKLEERFSEGDGGGGGSDVGCGDGMFVVVVGYWCWRSGGGYLCWDGSCKS